MSNDRIPAWAAAVNLTAVEPPYLIIQRRMMLNVTDLEGKGA